MYKPAPRRKLKVDLKELAWALEDSTPFGNYFLDLDTGRIIFITVDTRSALERFVEELGDEDDFDVAIEEAIARSNYPDDEKVALREANHR